MLEGKELEGQIGDVGGYSLDVDDKGLVTVSIEVKKDFDGGSVSSVNSAQLSLFAILEKAAASTATPWDDKAVEMIEKLLGIKKA